VGDRHLCGPASRRAVCAALGRPGSRVRGDPRSPRLGHRRGRDRAQEPPRPAEGADPRRAARLPRRPCGRARGGHPRLRRRKQGAEDGRARHRRDGEGHDRAAGDPRRAPHLREPDDCRWREREGAQRVHGARQDRDHLRPLRSPDAGLARRGPQGCSTRSSHARSTPTPTQRLQRRLQRTPREPAPRATRATRCSSDLAGSASRAKPSEERTWRASARTQL
jgi:hypothetical protein